VCGEKEEEKEGRREEEKFHNYDNYVTNNESSSYHCIKLI
jgi:hypothetical protein